MTTIEAKKTRADYYQKTIPTDEDSLLYAEALKALIEETKDSDYMAELGDFYNKSCQFDLAIKYYELAAQHNNRHAITSLGHIWYSGHNGIIDYEKAFSFFDRARKMGDMIAAYSIADMYKNGCFVEKNTGKYKEIIEDIYLRIKDTQHPDDPLPEIFSRMAKIRTDEGNIEEALKLYNYARDFLAQRIKDHSTAENLDIMKQLTNDIYQIQELDEDDLWLYDLYYVLKGPTVIKFCFDGTDHEIMTIEDDDGIVVRFDDEWFCNVDDFFRKAKLVGLPLTTLYEELYLFEMI